MSLSDYEKFVLEQMEEELRKEDPELVSQLSTPSRKKKKSSDSASPTKVYFSPRKVAIGLLMAILGIIGLVFAVSMGRGIETIIAAIMSFSLMLFGVLYALRPVAPPRAKAQEQSKSGGSPWARFIENQERRWDERSS